MRKTSHDGADATSITSGFENEIKKSGTAGLLKMKKSSIKRKVPSFSHESDDGIVEPLLQTEREKIETGTRSAKFLLTKVKTDSISENEDSINMTEININKFFASTSISTSSKPFDSNNTNNIKDSNFTSHVTEAAPVHNHMNTNIFGGSDISKPIVSTKSPILVELDVSKTSGYNPSLIFTTAKIHTDCKTKLMEPVQITPVTIISTLEKTLGKTEQSSDADSKTNDMNGKKSDVPNIVSENSIITNKDINIDHKASKAILNLKEKTSPIEKTLNSMPKKSLPKDLEDSELKKCNTKSEISTLSLSSEIHNSNDNNIDSKSQGDKSQILPELQKCKDNKPIVTEKSMIGNKSFLDNTNKFEKDQTINTNTDKKITVQGSKKLQRQKKAAVEESQESSTGSNILNEKLSTGAKISTNIALTTQSKSSVSTVSTTAISFVNIPTSFLKMQAPNSTNNVMCKSESQVNNKASSKVLQAKDTDFKSQIPTSIYRVSTSTASTSNALSSSPASSIGRTTQGTEIQNKTIKQTLEKQDSTIIVNQSPQSIKQVTVDNSPPVTKSPPPYIVSTSKTKIGLPITTSATLQSDSTTSTGDLKYVPNTNYLVKTMPSSGIITTSTTLPVTSNFGVKQSDTGEQSKSKTDKQGKDSRA